MSTTTLTPHYDVLTGSQTVPGLEARQIPVCFKLEMEAAVFVFCEPEVQTSNVKLC